jgi:cytosol alanyl aminopeptidase
MKRSLISRVFGAAVVVLSTACSSGQDGHVVGPSSPRSPPAAVSHGPASLEGVTLPVGRLPPEVRPLQARLSLVIDPEKPTFQGSIDLTVQLDAARDIVWIHGRDLRPSLVTITPEGRAPLPTRWDQVTPAGLVALRPEARIEPGKAGSTSSTRARSVIGKRGCSA